jgi:tetratricopeptide (TPR) repeat protein
MRATPPAAARSGAPPQRNDACPCGSGRKYKLCCGAPGAQRPGEAAAPPGALLRAATPPRPLSPAGQFLHAVTGLQRDHAAPDLPGTATLAAWITAPAGADDKPPTAAPAARAALAHLARSRQFAEAGYLPRALVAARQATQADPANAIAQLECGILYLRGGLFDDAIRALHQATVLKPDSARAWFHLGMALDRVSNEPTAIGAYQRAVALAPGMTEAFARLGGDLIAVGRYDEAREALTRAAASPDDPIGRHSRARLLMLDERFAEAETVLRRGIARDPGDSAALHLLGDILARLGRFTDAAAAYEQAVKVAPDHVALYLSIAQSRRIGADDRALVAQMEHHAGSGRLAESELMLLHFALGKSYDDLKDPAAAMRHFDAAHRIRGRVGQFDRAEWEKRIGWLIERYSPELLAGHAGIGVADPTPILILGMPRSGTTLMEQIVSSHPSVAAGDELMFWGDHDAATPGFDPQELTAETARHLAETYLAVLRGISPDRPRVTDKMPFNYLAAGLIHLVLPNARIIHCRRNPIDTCLSIYTNYFTTKMQFASDRRDLVFYYRMYERLMAHWRRVLPADRFLEIDYETLIADRGATTRRIIAFLGLPWDDACDAPERNERKVKTASMWQARQPVYASSVERWRRYEPWIGELRQLLEPGPDTPRAD